VVLVGLTLAVFAHGCRPSLAGLRRGAVLCVPGLDDASALDGMRAAEGHLFKQAWANRLVERSIR
jgi:hypothetical protein